MPTYLISRRGSTPGVVEVPGVAPGRRGRRLRRPGTSLGSALRRAGDPLVGIRRPVQVRRAHRQDARLLDNVHDHDTWFVAIRHPENGSGSQLWSSVEKVCKPHALPSAYHNVGLHSLRHIFSLLLPGRTERCARRLTEPDLGSQNLTRLNLTYAAVSRYSLNMMGDGQSETQEHQKINLLNLEGLKESLFFNQ